MVGSLCASVAAQEDLSPRAGSSQVETTQPNTAPCLLDTPTTPTTWYAQYGHVVNRSRGTVGCECEGKGGDGRVHDGKGRGEDGG